MSASVNYIVEIKRGGKWEPAVPLTFKQSLYDNPWIFYGGCWLTEIFAEINGVYGIPAYPTDSPTISSILFMYPPTNTPQWKKNAIDTIYSIHRRLPNWMHLPGYPVLEWLAERYENYSIPTPGHGEYIGTATMSEIMRHLEILESDLEKSIETYANENVLINEIREILGKERQDTGYYTNDVTEYSVPRLNAFSRFIGQLDVLRKLNEIDDTENVRVIWWIE